MEENKKEAIQYFVFEGEMARAERHIKRLWIALIIAVICLAITNIAWLYYESQFETVSYSQDGEGLNNINAGTQGDVYGAEGQDPETKEPQT